MNEGTGRVRRSFWVVGAVAVIWNALGVANFLIQMSAGAVAAMPEEQRAIISGRPVWATAAFALVVFSGAIGGILLLLRKSVATWFFVASLIGVIVEMLPYVLLPASTFSASIVLYALMPLAVAAWVLWYTHRAKRKGWLQ